ncbi:NADP(+)-dependent dehydrogenase [Purpureocillium lilacinum]|uniref:NADP(+)-dependent dehydrogenase n=1 Tax=Purpureocillium lilacinum TaxID=33203 RepID=A0A179GB89_PURLI|nr:NADP(+)-dependent dehydrogenase [Purpureocillium lilacinum]OAQ74409.1 NADP(+)-dependent dehydrogenase [Purpureocillium lilacinum]
MSQPLPSYTKVLHNATYDAINPRLPALSTAGKVVLITGASGGIGRATTSSFAASGPKALVLLGRNLDALSDTAAQVAAADAAADSSRPIVRTHAVDLCDAARLSDIMASVADEFGGIDILVHCAGHLPPIAPLLSVDPANFLKGFETTVTGTLAVAQAVLLANGASPSHEDTRKDAPAPSTDRTPKPVTFINLTSAGALFPSFRGMGTYVTCKLAAIKLLQAMATENPQMHVVNVHPGFLRTNMSAQLEKDVTLPFPYDNISLPSDFLVWVASSEASFLRGKIVYAAWDVNELKELQSDIIAPEGQPGGGDLFLGFQGFPRYIGGRPVGALPHLSRDIPAKDNQ